MTIRVGGWTIAQTVMIAAPIALIASMYAAFQQLTHTFGFPNGYFVAFLVYWLGWCVALPVAMLGRERAIGLFKSGRPYRQLGRSIRMALWWPVIFPLLFAFIPRIAAASLPIVGMSIVVGTITGATEELLWRGAYLTVFPESIWLNTVFPSVAFGLWHLCPLSVVPSRYPGGMFSFAAYSIALGLSYAYAARKAHSIYWTTVSHCVHDVLGLGGFVYTAWLA